MGKVTVHQSTHLASAKCLRAGFLSSASDIVVTLTVIVTIIAISALTVWLRNTARPSSKEKEAPAAAATSSTEPESDESENDRPHMHHVPRPHLPPNQRRIRQ
ncbi:hypothetical protein GMDG_07902 [Pseudogymnoascus destructans 20631-21]|uniref:Uncharacterized protein n=1 Tax=Pseudogymnoascus destructans (strain ATCC MYA-4855 / 20631-21) TaxID=658429 RepID=L8G2U3_PSED2|nr:hypothetical protein GMDG_07902 [Pseudogymnoascus destructans 20631-21]